MTNVIKNPKDFCSGLFFVAVGIGTTLIAQGYGMGTARQMGAGSFPAILGMLLTLVGAIITGRSFFGRASEFPRMYFRQGFFILTGMLLFGLLIRAIGLPLSILLMVVVGAFAHQDYRPAQAIVVGAILAVTITVIFVFLLGQPIALVGWAFGG